MKISSHIITAILRRDSKDATYKFALLRALVQTVTEQMAHKRYTHNPFLDPNRHQSSLSTGKSDKTEVSLVGLKSLEEQGSGVSFKQNEGFQTTDGPLRTAPFLYAYPLGLLIWYWLQYYYPLFAHSEFIPQKNGESDRMEPGKTLAIRRLFLPVIEFYGSRGGFAQLYYDLLRNEVPSEIRPKVLDLFRGICDTLVKMPMYHMGYSVFGEPYSLVRAKKGRITGLSYGSLLHEAGLLYIHPDLHEVIDTLGGLLVGDDSIVSGWASFTASLSRRTQGKTLISEASVLSLLRSDPVGDRDVVLARKILEQQAQRCVWSGQQTYTIHVDHMLPFSLTRNNSLWNLVPVTPAVNLKKSDKIPTPELVSRSSERIEQTWKLFEMNFEALFWQEVYEGLGVAREAGVEGALQSLGRRCEYLIQTRGLEAFRG